MLGDLSMTRIKAIDTAKGLGILFIVLGHTVPDSFLRQVLYSFHIPLFFILSGFTYKNKKNKFSFVVSKATRLLLPYAVFAIISILIFYVMALVLPLQGEARIIPNILGMLYANSNSGYMTWNRPLWFLPCLFATTILVDIFESQLSTCKAETIRLYRCVFIFCSLAIGIFLNVFLRKCYLPLHLESAIFLASFYELGIMIADGGRSIDLDCRIRDKIVQYCFLSFILICIGIVLSYVNGSTDIRVHAFGKNPIFLIMTSLVFCFSTMIFSIKLENKKWLQYIGTRSLAIMLMHKFPILFFQEVVPVTKVLLEKTDTLPGFFCGFIVAVLTIIMCLIAERIIVAVCPWMLGIIRKK